MTVTIVTKSVRFLPEESEELAKLSQASSISESALMKQWILEGIRAKKLDLAIQAYLERKTDLRGGASMAGVSYNRFLREVQARNIVVLENDDFLDELAFLAETFDSQALREAVDQVRAGEPGQIHDRDLLPR